MDAQNLMNAVMASSMHEIKNNLGVLFARIDRLTESLALAAEQENDLRQIKSLGNHLNHELVRVLLLYKSNSGNYTPLIEQYALADVFEDAVVRHRITADTHGVSISIACDDDLLGFFDESLINSLLDTLIFNSVKADATQISLEAREENGMLVICVKDNGPGFPDAVLHEELLPKTGHGSGTGLGLYFAHTIARLHENKGVKGFIRLLNRTEASGACVEVWLP